MKKHTTIGGISVILAFNMATQITFEELTGKPFAQIDTKKGSDLIALIYGCIVANNPDTKITMDYLLHEATSAEIQQSLALVTESFNDWNNIPDTLADDEDIEEDGGEVDNTNDPAYPEDRSEEEEEKHVDRLPDAHAAGRRNRHTTSDANVRA